MDNFCNFWYVAGPFTIFANKDMFECRTFFQTVPRSCLVVKMKLLVFYAHIFSKVSFLIYFHTFYSFFAQDHMYIVVCKGKKFSDTYGYFKIDYKKYVYIALISFIMKVNEWKWIISATFGMLLTRSLYLPTKMFSSRTLFPNRAKILLGCKDETFSFLCSHFP